MMPHSARATTRRPWHSSSSRLRQNSLRTTAQDVQVIGDNGATYARGLDGKPYPDGAAQWGQLVKYYYNHSIVQYNLTPDNTISTMPITGVHGFWNIFTLAALIAGIALIPTLYMFGAMRRRGGK